MRLLCVTAAALFLSSCGYIGEPHHVYNFRTIGNPASAIFEGFQYHYSN